MNTMYLVKWPKTNSRYVKQNEHNMEIEITKGRQLNLTAIQSSRYQIM